MILGYLIVGMLLGTISAAICLFLGSSLLWALVIYSIVGGLGTFLSAAIVYAISRLSEHGLD
jgi:Zn-dependent protease with chaperone function